MKLGVTLPAFLLLLYTLGYADTILLKDGQELKGVVVEDYHDRVVLSTEKGEICHFKSSIEKISYETPEENLVKLGALYKDKGDYKRALYCYEAAYKLNPDMKEARDGTLLVTNMLFRKRESDLEKEVALKQDTEEKMGRQLTAGADGVALPDSRVKELVSTLGLSIEKTGPDIKITEVLKGSPADVAGIKQGDTIISIWGKLLRYMPLDAVYDLFLYPKVSEIKLVVSRRNSVVLGKNRIFGGAESRIGARLSMEFEGLTVSEVKSEGAMEKAGIVKGDKITSLGGTSTRYMPLEFVYKLIENAKDNTLDVEIQREFTFWKR